MILSENRYPPSDQVRGIHFSGSCSKSAKCRHDFHHRHCRPPECRQIDPVQPPGRAAAGAGRRSAGRDARSPRGRREAEGRLGDLSFKVIDTAGLEDAERKTLSGRMQAQTAEALAQADAVLFLVDARDSAMPADRAFADLVRKSGKPTILVANKSEGRAGAAGALES